MQRVKKFSVFVLLLVFATVSLAGCSGSSTKSGSASQVTIAQGSDISTLDPHNALGTTTAGVIFHIFNSLTRTDANGKVVGDLAESFSSINPTTWEFKLRKGVKFHNGEPFNAAAVKFSVERMLDPKLKNKLASDFSFIKEVKVIDDSTIQLITKEPFAGLPQRMFYLAIVPPKYIAEKGNEEFIAHPVGTGPYKFKEWVKDDRVVLTANAEYYQGAPKVAQVIFKTIPEDASRIAALEAGEVDIISGVPSSQVERLKGDSKVEVVSAPTSRVMYVGLNSLNNRLLENQKFRQALNYAVDVDSIIKNILNGAGKRIATISVPQYLGYSANVKPYAHDISKAKQLLTEAGYNNEPLVLAVSPGAYQNAKEVTEAVAGQLKQAGVNVTVVEKESGLFRNDLMAGKIEPLYFNGIGGPYASTELLARIGFGTKERYSTFTNPAMDELRQKASATIDEQQAAPIWNQLQEMFIEQAPAIFLYQQYANYGYSKKIKNWAPRLDETILVDGISKE